MAMLHVVEVVELGNERRVHERFAMQVAVTATKGANSFRFLSEDLSVGGAKVVGHAAGVEVGEELDVTLALPGGGAPLPAKAEVRWSRGGAVGLRFGRVAQAALAAFFASVVGLSAGTVSANAAVPTFDPNATTELQDTGGERPDEYTLLGAFDQRRQAMDRCVESAKADADQTLPGTARMEVLLNPAGARPLGVNGTVTDGAPQDVTLLECLRAATASAPYPSYDGPPVVVEFDFELDAGFELED